MTQRYDTGFGPKYLDSNQLVQSATVPTLRGTAARMSDRRKIHYMDDIEEASSDAVIRFTAEDAGHVLGLVYLNGSVAADGSNGLELEFLNLTNSSDRVAYFGVGAGTEAVKATDKISAAAANTTVEIACTDTSKVNKGDVIQCTIDRDGTTIVGTIGVLMAYTGVGR